MNSREYQRLLLRISVGLALLVSASASAQAEGIAASIANSEAEVCAAIANSDTLPRVAPVSFGGLEVGSCAHRFLVLTNSHKRAIHFRERMYGQGAADFSPAVFLVARGLICGDEPNSILVGECEAGDPLEKGQSCFADLNFCPTSIGPTNARLKVLVGGATFLTLLLSGSGTGAVSDP